MGVYLLVSGFNMGSNIKFSIVVMIDMYITNKVGIMFITKFTSKFHGGVAIVHFLHE